MEGLAGVPGHSFHGWDSALLTVPGYEEASTSASIQQKLSQVLDFVAKKCTESQATQIHAVNTVSTPLCPCIYRPSFLSH